MDNITSTSGFQNSPNADNPLSSQSLPPMISESTAISKNEPVIPSSSESDPTIVATAEEINANENAQAHVDITCKTHDVALTSARTNNHQQNNGLTACEYHKMDIENNDEHPEKSKSFCSMLNLLFLSLTVVCFILFLGSIGYILNNLQRSNGVHDFSRRNSLHPIDNHLNSSEQLIDEAYINITNPHHDGIIVTLSRRGASVKNILIPYKDKNGSREYRSIVVKNDAENHFGCVRFGFDGPNNTMNVINQLPKNYPFLNYYKEDWNMYGNRNNSYRIRFVRDLIEIIYEISLENSNEFIMRTVVTPALNQKLIVDLTNNIYFNLRGYGTLNTHHLNLSLSDPMDILTGHKVEQNQLIQSQRVDQLLNISNYFYKLNRIGIGKNYIATLFENETKTRMRLFSDHMGVIIDRLSVGQSNENVDHATAVFNMHGVRISPRQSPVYQPMSIYGPISVVYPSAIIHTTWWQFEYEV